MAVDQTIGPIARIIVNLRGALCLLQFKDSGFQQVETNWSGARFSFVAAALALPVYFVLQWLNMETVASARAFAVALIIYALQWTLLPLIVYHLCRSWQRLDQYPRFLAGLNWMTVWQSLFYAVLLIVSSLHILPDALLAPLSLLLLVYLFAVEGFIAQRGLGITVMGAAGIVILDLTLVWQLGQVRAYLLR